MTTSAEIDAIVAGQTVPGQFLAAVTAHPHQVALRWRRDDGTWGEWTYAALADQVARAAAGLAARGLGRGDRMVLMMRNRPEFHVLDLAALFLGATPVSIYNSSAPDQIEYLANDAAARLAVMEDGAFLDALGKVRASIPSLTAAGVVDGPRSADFTYAELVAHDPIDLAQAAGTVDPAGLVTLIYTSGTTGPPKGVMIDHVNVCWTAECLRQAMALDDMVGKRIVSYLPMAHIAERMNSHYMALSNGMEVTCCPEPTQFASYATEVHPHIMFGVPRVWEKIYAGVQAALAADPEKEKAVREALEMAGPIRERMTWGTATDEDKANYEFLDAVAFSLIRGLVGLDQLVAAITGAAPIPAELITWFRTIGVPLSEIYGLSETSGPMTWEPYKVKPGTVGPPCPGVEVRLADDGEVLCRGGNVFRGYLNQPDKTAEVLDADGWFHSGDIGEIDADGYLRIVDRKKELIITAGGKNLSPANLEAALKTIPLVGQACVIGDNRPFVAALVVLDPDIAPGWAAQQGIPFTTLEALAAEPAVMAAIDAEVERVMAPFNRAESVRKVLVLGEEWLPDSDLLTPTSKLKRRGVNARYAEEIEALYG